MLRVRSGLDVLLGDATMLASFKGRRVGLLCHSASVDSTFEHAIDRLRAAGVAIEKLFAPEHGVRGTEQMMEAIDEARDPATGIPVVSLYGDTVDSLTPDVAAFDGIDVLIVDVQDVGVRYYTYATTAWQAVEVATGLGVRTVILDRPNPLGRTTSGPTLHPGFESFVGSLPMPTEHGLTLVEICHYARACGHDLEFEAILAEGWHGEPLESEAEYAWVMPSPNMPTLATAKVYAGMCLFEATNVSEGRGTTRPFELFGAPWLNPERVQSAFESCQLPGVKLRQTAFKPTFEKGVGEVCQGFQIHVTDAPSYRSLDVGVALVHAISSSHPAVFGWRAEPYEFVREIPALDLLTGGAAVRKLLESGAAFSDIVPELQTPAWLAERMRDSRVYGR